MNGRSASLPARAVGGAPVARSWTAGLVLALSVLLVGCSGPLGSPDASSPPTSPAPSGEDDWIIHPTGPSDLILREEVGGGFVPVGFFATQAPFFSLYGDGTVIYRDETAPLPEPGPDGIVRGHPFRVARLDLAQVQELLRFALTEGGLGIARERYDAPNVADAPTTTFVIRAAGLDKTVSVYALGLETPEAADALARRAFRRLDERLRGLISSGSLGGDVWRPDRWRGTLSEAMPVGAPVPWPWPDVAPADFVADPASNVWLPRRTMTPAEVEALGLEDIEGGFHGLELAGPDGKVYVFGLRPLLPDETG